METENNLTTVSETHCYPPMLVNMRHAPIVVPVYVRSSWLEHRMSKPDWYKGQQYQHNKAAQREICKSPVIAYMEQGYRRNCSKDCDRISNVKPKCWETIPKCAAQQPADEHHAREYGESDASKHSDVRFRCNHG